MRNMFDSTCKVFRNVTTKDPEYGRPVKNLNLVGTYPCLLTRKKQSYNKGTPNAIIDSSFMLYGEADMDIKAGDIVEVIETGQKFTASPPYKPGNDHVEVELEMKRDA